MKSWRLKSSCGLFCRDEHHSSPPARYVLLVHNKRRSTSQKSQFRHCHHSKWLFLGFRINIFWKSSRRNKATETFSAAMIQDSLQSLSYKALVQIGYPGPQEVLVVNFVFENHGGQPTKPSKSISFPSRNG